MAFPPPAFSLLLSLFFHLSVIFPTEAVGGFTVDLIHRDSPLSPFFNPSKTPSDRLRAAVRRSNSRAEYFARSASGVSLSSSSADSAGDGIRPDVMPDGYEYLMTLSLGKPPYEFLAIADTGSDLIWTQCQPCTDCYKQDAPLFNPEKSSTYRDLSCHSNLCSELAVTSCDGGGGHKGKCWYNYSYGDKSATIGVLASETFTFNSTGEQCVVSIPNMAFGCTHESSGTFGSQAAGLVGLGAGPLSLISQLGSSIDGKFSYCLVPYWESGSKSQLKFGAAADEATGGNVVSTPLFSRTPTTTSFYRISLVDITIGDVKIPAAIDQSAAIGGGNIIIDSGTTLTYLPSSVLQQVESALSNFIDLTPTQDPDGVFELCYLTTNSTTTTRSNSTGGDTGAGLGPPDITFGFDQGARVTLSAMHTFVQPSDGVVCLAMKSSDRLGVSIFGNRAQQNFLIEFDLAEKKISFSPTECAKL